MNLEDIFHGDGYLIVGSDYLASSGTLSNEGCTVLVGENSEEQLEWEGRDGDE